MKIQGIAAASGISIAKIVKFESVALLDQTEIGTTVQELAKLTQAIDDSKIDLQQLEAQTAERLGASEAEVFGAHLLVLQDPEYIGAIEALIQEGSGATQAIEAVQNQFMALFLALDDEYMKERAADVNDVSQRLMRKVTGTNESVSDYIEPTILVAHDLTPSDTAKLNAEFTRGFITEKGGKTSHSAIFARSLQIPAIVGATGIISEVQNGDIAIMNGETGEIFINPTAEQLEHYEALSKAQLEKRQGLQALLHENTVTKDGHHVELAANIGSLDDAKKALEQGAEGVGLFRTEFLYLERDTAPTEQEQFEIYRDVLTVMGERPVVVRTLDIGGDKAIPYLNMPKEDNPFLGLRAIRLCFANEELFRTQLRALLRASSFGNLKIMFPMISSIDEFRQARQWLDEEKEALIEQDVEVSDFEIGIMVEIPSAAILSPVFAKEVDFFSIGTNDLIQYTLAADRMNETISHLYEPFHPAIVSLVKLVIDSAHAQGKWVGMCGEMAGDFAAIPLLVALGLDEFSMSAPSVLAARKQINSLSKDALQEKLQQTYQQSTAEGIRAIWH
ncbi:phosphoenolpyruvate--protein phosphotransferase [Solibacillus isronensis]|uniref:phosphoenolpyruvate--protein phosphotransferase n=1 Tax=Solibacillus isronensis TaxID=412383 RepID=UPI0020400836|nr:phosphoenolpyruvate--protein phosphotransferase [Solibacillus isronensis]MCM3721150.1 phosphoenolpyruvate--protein phosphotransferase [Solibacillus isronensis]